MPMPEMLSPLLDVATAAMESFVSWTQEHEWIASKSLFLVNPGQGLDAKALELANSIGLDAGTMKVCVYVREKVLVLVCVCIHRCVSVLHTKFALYCCRGGVMIVRIFCTRYRLLVFTRFWSNVFCVFDCWFSVFTGCTIKEVCVCDAARGMVEF